MFEWQGWRVSPHRTKAGYYELERPDDGAADEPLSIPIELVDALAAEWRGAGPPAGWSTVAGPHPGRLLAVPGRPSPVSAVPAGWAALTAALMEDGRRCQYRDGRCVPTAADGLNLEWAGTHWTPGVLAVRPGESGQSPRVGVVGAQGDFAASGLDSRGILWASDGRVRHVVVPGRGGPGPGDEPEPAPSTDPGGAGTA
jgi:hypothetical protein